MLLKGASYFLCTGSFATQCQREKRIKNQGDTYLSGKRKVEGGEDLRRSRLKGKWAIMKGRCSKGEIVSLVEGELKSVLSSQVELKKLQKTQTQFCCHQIAKRKIVNDFVHCNLIGCIFLKLDFP